MFPLTPFRHFFRSPAKGDRKDPPMPDPTPPAPDLTAQLSALTEAMRQLAESHKTLLDAVKPVPAPPQTAPPAASTTVAGDPVGGASPAALNAVDYSKLSPLQQITLGLRQGAD